MAVAICFCINEKEEEYNWDEKQQNVLCIQTITYHKQHWNTMHMWSNVKIVHGLRTECITIKHLKHRNGHCFSWFIVPTINVALVFLCVLLGVCRCFWLCAAVARVKFHSEPRCGFEMLSFYFGCFHHRKVTCVLRTWWLHTCITFNAFDASSVAHAHKIVQKKIECSQAFVKCFQRQIGAREFLSRVFVWNVVTNNFLYNVS